MTELTFEQKEEQLFQRLDDAHEREESLKTLLVSYESKMERQKEVIAQLEATINHLTAEIRRLGVEMNNARAAAATSVQEYRAEVGG